MSKAHAGISSVYDRNVHKRELPPLKRTDKEKIDRAKARYGAKDAIIAELMALKPGELRAFTNVDEFSNYSRGVMCLNKIPMGEYYILPIRNVPDPMKKFLQKTFQGNVKSFQRTGDIVEFRITRLV